MNKELFRMLCANYGKDANIELHKLWDEELKDYDEYYLEMAIKSIIATDKYFPTLSKIIEAITSLPANEIPKEIKLSRMKIKPQWVNKKVINEEITEEDEENFGDFQKYIQEFRGEKKEQFAFEISES